MASRHIGDYEDAVHVFELARPTNDGWEGEIHNESILESFYAAHAALRYAKVSDCALYSAQWHTIAPNARRIRHAQYMAMVDAANAASTLADLISVLDTEINQLWAAWNAAQTEAYRSGKAADWRKAEDTESLMILYGHWRRDAARTHRQWAAIAGGHNAARTR